MKKRVFIGILLISIFLISCGEQQKAVQPTCNKPYILVGMSCCLDQNDNSICDNDEQPKAEEKGLTQPEEQKIEEKPSEEEKPYLKAHQIVLSSEQVEAGYSLDRSYSGRKMLNRDEIIQFNKWGLQDSFIKGYKKEISKSEEIRWLYFYANSFKNEEGAIDFFKNDTFSINKNYKKVRVCSDFDECIIYKKEYEYNFIPYKKYSIGIREGRHAVEIIYTGYNEEISDSELDSYFKKLKSNFREGAPAADEIALTEISSYEARKDKLKLIIVSTKDSPAVKKAGKYDYYSLDAFSHNSDKAFKTVELKIENNGVNNNFKVDGRSYTGFKNELGAYVLKDGDGNIYTIHSYTRMMEGYMDTPNIETGNLLVVKLAFAIYKDARDFRLEVYDNEDVEVGRVEFEK